MGLSRLSSPACGPTPRPIRNGGNSALRLLSVNHPVSRRKRSSARTNPFMAPDFCRMRLRPLPLPSAPAEVNHGSASRRFRKNANAAAQHWLCPSGDTADGRLFRRRRRVQAGGRPRHGGTSGCSKSAMARFRSLSSSRNFAMITCRSMGPPFVSSIDF